MAIPAEMTFSQNNLQDLVDCPRRFELRYLKKLAWPAPQTEPVIEHERQMQMGARFHQMVHQHQLGLSEELVGAQATDPLLHSWWLAYLDLSPSELPAQRYPEFTLTAPYGGFRLIAKYDLIAIDPGRQVVIVDWKTSYRRTPRSTLRSRIQTRLYPFLMVEAGKQIFGGTAVQPKQIEMRYWFTADPGNPEVFQYTNDQYQSDRQKILDLINLTQHMSETIFPLTTEEKDCRFCNYRSLCKRGDQAGTINEKETELEAASILDIDFEQIGEIEF